MKNALKSKVVVITGASSGIGEAMAKVYAAMGAKVVLGARSEDKLKALADKITSDGGEAAYCATDVTVAEDCKRLIDTAVETFGGIDVLYRVANGEKVDLAELLKNTAGNYGYDDYNTEITW